jgi:DNA-binding CsgD family transcriptional regulator
VKGGWQEVSPELRELIESSCTFRQIEALKLKAAGYSLRRIGTILNLDEASVRGLLHRASRRIQGELAARQGIV